MIDVSFESGFDFSSDVIYYPVRHHSPVCSFHLKKTIAEYKPDCILIEAPQDADFLIQYLNIDNVRPPICIYSSFDDKKGVISEEKGKYRAYYPFLSYSPEFTAVCEANSNGIPVHFIDMPYPLQLVNLGINESTYYFGDDNSEIYYKRVAEKSRCRSFSEFWEKSFEVNGLKLSTQDFVKSIFMLGRYMRKLSQADEKNLFRECFMRRNIADYRKNFKRILVIAGAYHIDGLIAENQDFKFKKYDQSSSALYLMPYSFAETDSRSGYGAGISFPSFYSAVWKKIGSEKEYPYEETVRDFIVNTSRYARTKNHPLSVTDEIQALYMAKELAVIRDKSEPGAFELIDGIKSAFVKGEITSSSSFELDFLFRQMTGLGIGEVNISGKDTAIIPPCVDDFRIQCKKHRINLGSLQKQNTVLDIVKNINHYHKSCFLHRMEYLNTGFCHFEKGPDYVKNKDTSLVREQWSVRYSTSVEAKLIDLSVYGSSIENICRHMLKEQFATAQNASSIGFFLISTYTMGFSDTSVEFLPDIKDIIRNDSDFISQCDFMTYVSRLLALQRMTLSKNDDKTLELLKISFSVALNKLEDVGNVSGESVERICKGIHLMYSLTSDYPEKCSRNEFLNEIEKFTGTTEASPQIYGTCLAICAKSNIISEEVYCDAISQYMLTADGVDTADFLTGIISVGRDVIFISDKVLLSIDSAFKRMERDRFIAILPQLRRAFTAFLPSETAKISKKISLHYGVGEDSLQGSIAFTADDILFASECDMKASEIMKKWGLLNGGDTDV